MFFTKILYFSFYLLSDVLTSLYRRFTGKRAFVCKYPFDTLHISSWGYRFCCHFTEFGDFSKYANGRDFLCSDELNRLREMFLKGDYSSCPQNCHVLINGDHFQKRSFGRLVMGDGGPHGEYRKLRSLFQSDTISSLNFTQDDRCNLSCIMCRDKVDRQTLSSDKIDSLWSESAEYISSAESICLGGSGEPLIQKQSLDMLHEINEASAPMLKKVFIMTNGLNLTEELWDSINPYLKDKLEIQISVDATTKNTYESIRRGGNFDELLRNIKFIASKQLRFFGISMCVQESNLHEMKEFVSFARQFGATPVFGEVLLNPDMACHLKGHKLYDEFCELKQDPIFSEPDIIANFVQS